MNAPIDTLAFAKSFEDAGFGHDQARALASAFGQAHTAGREDLVTKNYLNGKLGEMEVRLVKQISDSTAMMTRQIAENGRDISNRLWSTITIIAGVATAISATIGAGVALLLHAKGI